MLIKINPHLVIGDQKDAFNILNTFFDVEHEIKSVIDVTTELPTKKWNKNKNICLSKIGFEINKPLPRAKIRRVVEFIKEQHRFNKPVMVAGQKDDPRSVLLSIAFLCFSKAITWEEAIKIVLDQRENFLDKFDDSMVSSVKRFAESVKK